MISVIAVLMQIDWVSVPAAEVKVMDASGFTVMVHASKVMKSNMNIEEVSSFVISVGVDYAKPGDAETLYK